MHTILCIIFFACYYWHNILCIISHNILCIRAIIPCFKNLYYRPTDRPTLSAIELLSQLKMTVSYAQHYMHSIHILLTQIFDQNFELKFHTKILDQNFGLDFWTRLLDQNIGLDQNRLDYNILIHFPKCNIGLQNSLLTDRQTDKRTLSQIELLSQLKKNMNIYLRVRLQTSLRWYNAAEFSFIQIKITYLTMLHIFMSNMSLMLPPPSCYSDITMYGMC